MANWYEIARQTAASVGHPDPDLFARQMQLESAGFSEDVIYGKRNSSAGAQGIAQFMPATAKGLRVNPLDPDAALRTAAKLMASYYGQYGNWPTALAAYNAGAGAVEKYGGVPPFEETQRYVKNILSQPRQKKAPKAPGLASIVPSEQVSTGVSKMARRNEKSIDEQLDEIGIPGGTGSTPLITTPVVPTTSVEGGNPKQESTTLRQIEAKKGRWIEVVPKGDLTIKDEYGFPIPNPTPTYQYIWPDGSYLNVSGTGGVSGTALNDLAPTNPSASKPSYVPAGQVDRTQRWIVYFDPVTGTNKEIQNPNYDEEYAALEAEKARAAIAASNRSGLGSPSEFARVAQDSKEFDWRTGTEFPWKQDTWTQTYDQNQKKIDNEAAQNEALRKQWAEQNEQSKNQLASSMADWMTKSRLDASKWAMLPGQEYFLGAEPSGVYANIARMNNRQFDPNTMRPQPTDINPEDAWRRAQSLTRGGK